MGKNKHTKSSWKNTNTMCNCFYCMRGGVERYQKLKYNINKKHNKKSDYISL